MTTLIVILCYLLLLLSLGFFSNRLFRGTSKDYFVASHSIGPFLLLMSVFGTTMTAFALVGSTGKSFERGIGTYGLMRPSAGWYMRPFSFWLVFDFGLLERNTVTLPKFSFLGLGLNRMVWDIFFFLFWYS